VNLPILIAVGRALATAPVCGLLAVANPGSDALALAIFILAALSDVADGALARARREVTALGMALDPLADKILIIGTLTALAVRGLVPLWAVSVVVARELVAIEVRARATGPLPASADGKAKAILQAAAVGALIASAATSSAALSFAANALLLAAVALTVLSGVRLVRRAAYA
jgi:CDP-diacylglycerol--glycerol-3-phosphate 3-phosphatidyltransferase